MPDKEVCTDPEDSSDETRRITSPGKEVADPVRSQMVRVVPWDRNTSPVAVSTSLCPSVDEMARINELEVDVVLGRREAPRLVEFDVRLGKNP